MILKGLRVIFFFLVWSFFGEFWVVFELIKKGFICFLIVDGNFKWLLIVIECKIGLFVFVDFVLMLLVEICK